MIHELDATIEQLLQTNLSGEVNISFEQPNKEWTKSPEYTSPSLNLFLFDIRENNLLRQHQWQTMTNENGNGRSYKKRTPYRFDCHYLLTAWANKVEDQHWLLSEAMMALLQHPTLPKDVLVGSLKKQPFDIQGRVGSHDKLTNPAELWSAIDNDIRAAVSYIVTIALSPWEAEQMDAPVQTKRLLLQQRDAPKTAVETVEVGGHVNSEDPLPTDLVVTLENEQWRYEGVVDKNGRYRINHVTPDTYTLTAWQQTGQGSHKKLASQKTLVPPPVQILAFADTFQLQIGKEPPLVDLHLSSRRPGYVGKIKLDEFKVESVGELMPRTGSYHFGLLKDDGEERITAVIKTSKPKEKSFQLVYKKPEKHIGNYDLTI